jgi:hypothetical protein
LLINAPATHKAVDTLQRSTQSLGKGFIKVSEPADDHNDTITADTPTPPAVSNNNKTTHSSVIKQNMLKVRTIAKEVGHHETMQAILLQETNGGTSHPVGNLKSPIGKRSYGIMQVQLVAGRSVLERRPELAERYFPDRKLSSVMDEEIIALLLSNDEANIRIAVHHFDIYHKLSKGNWMKAVAAYNMGIGNALKRASFDDVPYVKSIQKRISTTVKPFNKSNPGQLTL